MYEPIVDKFKYVPESALIELCFKCNLNCKHCGSSLNAYKKSRKGEPLSLTEFYSAIDDLKGLGGKRIGLVGGEPLLYENWEEVAKYASDRNFYVSMISNGMIIDDEMAHKIKKCGIALVALSLDGPETYHNELRGSQMAFKKCTKSHSIIEKRRRASQHNYNNYERKSSASARNRKNNINKRGVVLAAATRYTNGQAK